MVWSDSEITQSFIAENKKQSINFNTRCVLTMRLFSKFVMIVVSSNKLPKIVLMNSVKHLKIEQSVTFEGPRM